MPSEESVKILKEGGVVIFPTDTAVGIGCRINDEKAIERIYEIRHRPPEKPLLILVSSFEMAEEYALPLSEKIKKILHKYWPGGVTFILPANSQKVLPIVRAGKSTIAIRFPQHKEIVEIIKKVGVPIVAPSANFSGERTPLTIEEVDENLKKKVDFVLTGMCTMKGVSTIVDLTTNPYQIVREGVVTIDDEDIVS